MVKITCQIKKICYDEVGVDNMFNIEELINLFDNENAKKMLLSAYNESQKTNKKVSDEVFKKLLSLKKIIRALI